MRVLVLGAGVIGGVYAAKLQQAGHEVVLLARDKRLGDLEKHGLVLQDMESGHRDVLSVACVSQIPVGERYGLVLVPVRSEQLPSTLPMLRAMTDGSDVLFFGNTAGTEGELVAALGDRAVFGFPAAGGMRKGPAVNYMLIAQQKTMLGEYSGTTTPRVLRLQGTFRDAGFATKISANIDNWMLGHASFVLPIAFALYSVGIDPARLAQDPHTLRLMIRATRQGFAALQAAGNTEIPTNLRTLYRLPTVVVASYWRRTLAGPRGELWFGAHTRAAPEEMGALAQTLLSAVHSAGHPTPDLDLLLATPKPVPTTRR